jgi:hypothetical protein
MNLSRIRDLSDSVYRSTFELLDAELETHGDDCGQVAEIVRNAFVMAMSIIFEEGQYKELPVHTCNDILSQMENYLREK